MKVLFVSSGRLGDTSYLVKNQGESLTKRGVIVDFYIIEGSGILGYLKTIPKLRRKIKEGKYDIVHAHYSFSAFAASLAGSFPLVVSLMGSDAYMSTFWRWCAQIFCFFRWDATIVKTKHMEDMLKMSKLYVIPNGVNMERFTLIDKDVAREKIKYFSNKKLVVFIADPGRPEKNYALAQQAVANLNSSEIELMPVYNVSNDKIPYFLNAADVLLLTSKWEGSVNVIKEALACNLPIVSTDVGDVKFNISGVDGCYVCDQDVKDLSEKLSLAISYDRRTKGRQRIVELGLDSDSIATRLIEVYNSLLK